MITKDPASQAVSRTDAAPVVPQLPPSPEPTNNPHDAGADAPALHRPILKPLPALHHHHHRHRSPTRTTFNHGLPTPTSPSSSASSRFKPQSMSSSFFSFVQCPRDEQLSSVFCDEGVSQSHMKPRRSLGASQHHDHHDHDVYGCFQGSITGMCTGNYEDQRRIYHLHLVQSRRCPNDEMGFGYSSGSED